MNKVPRPVVLCVLDGWGEAPAAADNAILAAETPVWDALKEKYPHGLLHCSGLDVGLPRGQMGNSEVGHMNLGAGRAVLQHLPRVDAAIADGSLASLSALTDFIDKLRRSGGCCHLMGLLSPGDTIIDGGNSNYKDSIRRSEKAAGHGVDFLDAGTSGGIWGLQEGYALMVGGNKAAYERLEPIFQSLAPAADRGVGRVGPSGAGHFTKMLHNGIEDGMM